MKRSLMTVGFTLALSMATFGTWQIAHAQSDMQDQQSMMQMMQNRPKSMKSADAAISKTKKAAAAKGMYSCCLKHSCDLCALKMGACACAKSASMGKPVCNECKGGWAAGDGRLSSLRAEDIKTFPRMDMNMTGKMGN